MAKRVTESISTSTSLPSSRKYSAMASVTWAAWRRISAGSSEVETTTTERARPASPKIVLQEFLHLAAAFADQADDGDVGGDVAGQHRQQHRFADAGAGENAQALAATAGQKGIERAHAEIERRADAAARMRQRRRIAERIRRRPVEQRALAVDRLAQRVDHPPEPADRRPHRAGDRRNHGPAAAPNAFERRKRHQQSVAAGKSDHLAGYGLRRRLNNDPRADRHRMQRAGDLNHQPAHADHTAVDLDTVELVDLFGQSLHAPLPGR